METTTPKQIQPIEISLEKEIDIQLSICITSKEHNAISNEKLERLLAKHILQIQNQLILTLRPDDKEKVCIPIRVSQVESKNAIHVGKMPKQFYDLFQKAVDLL
jgi:hypothetical protein